VCTLVHHAGETQPLLGTLAHQYPMPGYTATVTVRLKSGVLDPEATTTQRALERLEFDVEDLRFADRYEVDLDADSAAAARERAGEMAERLLANPTIHDYEVAVAERGDD
jgi:phosphoribosylformylglycinamidine synthase PurS subunit